MSSTNVQGAVTYIGVEKKMMKEEVMSSTGSGWTELPLDLLSLIFNKVMSFSLSDYVRISAVCLEWRLLFFTENYEHIQLPNKLPVLLFPSSHPHPHHHHHHHPIEGMNNHHHQQQQQEEEEEEEEEGDLHDYYNPREIWLGLNHKQRHQSTRSFYSISEKKVYDFQLPIPSYLNCRGSSHGWLIVVEECTDGTYPVHLLNPFRSDNNNNNNNNNNKIHLPPLTSTDPRNEVFHSYFLRKAILSADPSSSSSSSSSLIISNPATTNDELVVLGLYYNHDMGFCRPGDRAWTPLPSPGLACMFDFICYKGQYWGVLQNGCAVVFDMSPLLPKPNVTTVIEPSKDDYPHPMSRYLVESAGNLFQVRRDIYMDDNNPQTSYSTVGFQVFKLDWEAMEWVKTNSLDGCMFFLGSNTSISLSASDYYFSGGSCKPNSIYFTDDFIEGFGSEPEQDGPHDMGVFNLDDGSFERFEPYYTVDSRYIMPYLDPTNAISSSIS